MTDLQTLIDNYHAEAEAIQTLQQQRQDAQDKLAGLQADTKTAPSTLSEQAQELNATINQIDLQVDIHKGREAAMLDEIKAAQEIVEDTYRLDENRHARDVRVRAREFRQSDDMKGAV